MQAEAGSACDGVAEDRLLWYSTTHKDWEFCNTTAPLTVRALHVAE